MAKLGNQEKLLLVVMLVCLETSTQQQGAMVVTLENQVVLGRQ
jgi:hypothetical protein